MNAAKKPSRQDILKRRQQSSFVGREEQLQAFRDNLTQDPEEWCFLFNVSGQGGVGKSTLLDQFRNIAKSKRFITAKSYEADTTVPEAMGRLAEELEASGYPLKTFTERYTVYRQKQEELETDPEAPQGFSAFMGKSIAKATLGLAKQVPGSGAVTPFIDEDAFTTQAGEWTSYVTKKLRNKDEVQLVQEPVEVLTPLFLQDLEKVTQKTSLVLFFDTYERTSKFLDPWLRDILQGNYGALPAPIIIVIAGRTELNRNTWADYESAIIRFSLDPFTDAEAQQFFKRKGITNPKVIEVILKLSGYLPLLVATLAENSPQDPNQIGDRCDLAVERFLQWETDPKRRQIALDAALPRVLNRDIVAQLSDAENPNELFEWLRHKPFVRQGAEGWEYHEVVRTQMLRYKRKVSPQSWSAVHGKLADYYEQLQRDLQLDESQHWREPTWQKYALHILYHRLCQSPQKYLVTALNNFLAALKANYKFAKHFAEVMVQVGQETEFSQLKSQGVELVEGLDAYGAGRYADSLKMFTTLIKNTKNQPKSHSTALTWRGLIYQSMEQYEEALADCNRAIELDSDNDWAITGRGETYQSMGRYEAALADCNRAIELSSENDWRFYNRAIIYLALNRNNEAKADFEKAIQLAQPEYEKNPQNWQNTFNLALYHLASNSIDRATLLYQQAYRQGASIESIREAIQDLRDFLTMFPDYQLAKNFKKTLEKGLEKRFNQIKNNQEV
jgi:tetratricopeptide (TPR) repeat protein